MCQKSCHITSPFDVFSHVGPSLIPFLKGVIIYYVLWLPLEYPSVLSAVVKCFPILCLTSFVWFQGVSLREEHDYQRRVFVGLIFSGIGDALLIWHETHFITAMISFAIAHMAYMRAFGFSKIRWFKGIPFIGMFILVIVLFYPGLHGILLPGVYIYVCILCSMGWRAIAQVDILENEWTWTSLSSCIGAALFMLSDCVIGIDKFMMPVPFARVLIMTMYYSAQAFISLSAVNKDDLVIKLRMSTTRLNDHHD